MKNHTVVPRVKQQWGRNMHCCLENNLWSSFLNKACKSAEPAVFRLFDGHGQQTESSEFLHTWRAPSTPANLANIDLPVCADILRSFR